MKKIILLFFGPQGSGKGTQADLLARKNKFKIISTGDIFRQELKKSNKLSRLVNKYYKAGKLVPDDLTGELVQKAIKQNKNKPGFIFDGYPRNSRQLKYLLDILESEFGDRAIIYGLNIHISDKEALKRLKNRRSCSCGRIYHLIYNLPKEKGMCDVCHKKLFIRADDYPEAIKQRLKLYHDLTKPLFNYWSKKGRLIKINGEQSIMKIHKDIISELKKLKLIS